MFDRMQVRKGMEVCSLDGKKLGKVLACDDVSFTIERGLFFPKDYVARYHEITSISGDEIRLGLSKEALEEAREHRAEVASPAEVARTMTPAAETDDRTRRVREADPATRASPIPAHPARESVVTERRAAENERPLERRDDWTSDEVMGTPRRGDPDIP